MNSGLVIKNRVLIITFFAISSLVAINFFLVSSMHKKDFHEAHTHFDHITNDTMKYIINDTKEHYLMLAKSIINTNKVKELIKQAKREELHALLLSEWELLKSMNPELNIMLFHKADGTAFLRMHKPKVYNDYLSEIRPMVKAVHEQRKVLSGYETGKYSTVYRVITPIFYKGEYLGALDFGINPNYFIEKMYEATTQNGVFFVKDENLKLFKRKSKFQLNGYTLQSKVSEQTLHLLRMLPKEYLLNDKILLSDMGQKYILHVIDLKDYCGETEAKLIFFHDVTFFAKNQNSFLIAMTLMTVGFLIVIFFLLNSSFNNLLKKLEKLYKEHFEMVQEKDKIILAQSKHAAMGEMISMIAHQWRQPIMVIAMVANNIKMDIELEEKITTKELEKIADTIDEQTQYLSKTIDDFRNFFKPNEEKTSTKVITVLNGAMKIIGKSLQNNNINVDINNKSQRKLLIHSNQLLQVFLNIISNAKDILVEKGIEQAKITINIDEDEKSVIATICDNGGGIPQDIIDRLSEPYFTTKQSNGTGLGLYMSVTIVTKHLNGSLTWENMQDGACFIVTLPKE